MKTKYILMSLMFCVSACNQANSNRSSIVFIGDEIRNEVLENCRQTGGCLPRKTNLVISPPKNADAVTTAQFSNQAKQAVLVVDSKSGPLPIIREHILIARQTQVPSLAVLFADSELIDDKELIALEVEEIQKLIESYDMGDKLSKIYYGKQGLNNLIKDGEKIGNRNKTDAYVKTQHIHAQIYNMTKEESGIPLKNGYQFDVWISGQIVKAKLIAAHDIKQGEIADIELKFDKPIHTNSAERFLIQIDNRIVSAGFVSSVN